MNHTTDHPDPPVTITVARRVKPGCEPEYEKLAMRLSLEAKKFPGHLGTNLFRPASPTNNEYRIIYKFDSMSHYHQWQHSPIRKAIYQELEQCLTTPEHTQILTGLETWFTIPNHDTVIPPPRYKITIVSWLAIFPLVTIILTVFDSFVTALPIPLRAGFITLIAIPTMTYVLMPNMTKLFSRWLYPEIADNPVVPQENQDQDSQKK